MAKPTPKNSSAKQMHMTIDGHQVTISFAQEYNPNLSKLVRTTLLDSFNRKNELAPEASPA